MRDSDGKIYSLERRVAVTFVLVAAVITGGLAAFLYNTYVKPPQTFEPMTIEEASIELQDMRKELSDVKERIESVESSIDALHATIRNSGDATYSVKFSQMDAAVKDIEKDVVKIKDALGGEIDKNISVPLLRKDVEALEKSMSRNLGIQSRRIESIYQQNSWFIGVLVTFAVGFALVVIEFLRRSNNSDRRDHRID